MKAFYMRLKEIRKEKRLTQEELAEKADISRVMVSRYETGTVIPTVDVLINIADALDVSIDYLLGRTEYNILASGTPTSQQKQKENLPESREELRKFILDILKECICFDS